MTDPDTAAGLWAASSALTGVDPIRNGLRGNNSHGWT